MKKKKKKKPAFLSLDWIKFILDLWCHIASALSLQQFSSTLVSLVKAITSSVALCNSNHSRCLWSLAVYLFTIIYFLTPNLYITEGKWAFAPIYKLCSKMPFDLNYLVKCSYFWNSILSKSSFMYIFKWNSTLYLNFQKNLNGKICIELKLQVKLDIANVELHL